MKRFASGLVAILTMALAFPDGAFAQNSMTVQNASGDPGDNGVVVRVELVNSAAVGAFLFTLTDLEGDLIPQSVRAGTRLTDLFTLSPYIVLNVDGTNGKDEVRVFAGMLGAPLAAGNGVIVEVLYNVNAGATGGPFKLTLSDVLLADPSGAEISPVTATDGFFSLANRVNAAPTITNTDTTLTAEENQPFSFDVDATDVEGDAFTFSQQGLPVGFRLDATTGVISGTPEHNTAPILPILVTVTETSTSPPLSSSKDFILTVNPDGTKPLFSRFPSVQEIKEASAVFLWEADEPVKGKAEALVTNQQTGESRVLAIQSNPAETTEFLKVDRVTVDGLTASTDYTATVTITDRRGNATVSSGIQFKTPVPDTTPPIFQVLPILVNRSPNALTYKWSANEAANATLTITQKDGVDLNPALTFPTTGFSETGEITATGLDANALYKGRISLEDASGNAPPTAGSLANNPADVEDRTRPTSDTIGFGNTVATKFHQEGDVDYFSFTADAGLARMNLTGKAAAGATMILSHNDTAIDTAGSWLVSDLPFSGGYTVRVSYDEPYDSSFSDYSISVGSFSATKIVAADGSGDYLTIPDAINAVGSSDTILVRAGSYSGDALTISKSIVLIGSNARKVSLRYGVMVTEVAELRGLGWRGVTSFHGSEVKAAIIVATDPGSVDSNVEIYDNLIEEFSADDDRNDVKGPYGIYVSSSNTSYNNREQIARNVVRGRFWWKNAESNDKRDAGIGVSRGTSVKHNLVTGYSTGLEVTSDVGDRGSEFSYNIFRANLDNIFFRDGSDDDGAWGFEVVFVGNLIELGANGITKITAGGRYLFFQNIIRDHKINDDMVANAHRNWPTGVYFSTGASGGTWRENEIYRNHVGFTLHGTDWFSIGGDNPSDGNHIYSNYQAINIESQAFGSIENNIIESFRTNEWPHDDFVWGSNTVGIAISGHYTNSFIKNNIFRDLGTALTVSQGSNFSSDDMVNDNEFVKCSYGVLVNGVDSYIWLKNNKFREGRNGTPIVIENNGRAKVTFNEFESNVGGIVIKKSGQALIYDNVFLNNRNFSISMDEGAADVLRNTIRSPIHVGAVGVLIKNAYRRRGASADTLRIENNVIDSTSVGIWIEDAKQQRANPYAHIGNNTIQNTTIGIIFKSGWSSLTVINNTFSNILGEVINYTLKPIDKSSTTTGTSAPYDWDEVEEIYQGVIQGNTFNQSQGPVFTYSLDLSGIGYPAAHFPIPDNILSGNSYSENSIAINSYYGGVTLRVLKDARLPQTPISTPSEASVLGSYMEWTDYNELHGLGNVEFTGDQLDRLDRTRISNAHLIYRSNGDLWAATDAGASRFDSQTGTWTNYSAAQGLGSNTVNMLLEHSNGDLWAATEGGVSRFDSQTGTWTNYSAAQGLGSNTVNMLLEHSNGDLWAATEGGASRFGTQAGTWTNYSAAQGLGSNTVNMLMEHSNGDLWAATEAGLWKFVLGQDQWVSDTSPQTPGTPVFRLLGTRNGQTILALTENGLYRNDVATTVGWEKVLVSGYEREIRNGGSIPSTFGIIYDYVRDRLGYAIQPKYYGMAESDSSVIWVAATDGVHRYDLVNRKSVTYSSVRDSDGKSLDLMVAGVKSLSSGIWAMTTNGMACHFDQESGSWRAFRIGEGRVFGDADRLIIDCVEDADGGLWAMTEGVGVSHLGRPLLAGFPSGDKLEGLPMSTNAMHTTPDGQIWVAGDYGLAKYDQQQDRWNRIEKLNGAVINSMVVDDDNRIWLALRRGPASYPDYDFGPLPEHQRPAIDFVYNKRAIGLYIPDTDTFEFWLSENQVLNENNGMYDFSQINYLPEYAIEANHLFKHTDGTVYGSGPDGYGIFANGQPVGTVDLRWLNQFSGLGVRDHNGIFVNSGMVEDEYGLIWKANSFAFNAFIPNNTVSQMVQATGVSIFRPGETIFKERNNLGPIPFFDGSEYHPSLNILLASDGALLAAGGTGVYRFFTDKVYEIREETVNGTSESSVYRIPQQGQSGQAYKITGDDPNERFSLNYSGPYSFSNRAEAKNLLAALQFNHLKGLPNGYAGNSGGHQFVEAPTQLKQLGDDPTTVYGNSLDVTSFAEDQAGRIWFGQSTGVSSYDLTTGTTKRYSTLNGLPSPYVSRVFVAGDGSVWVGTGSGSVARLDNERGIWIPFSGVDKGTGADPDEDYGYAVNQIQGGVVDIKQTSDGELWIGVENGVRRMLTQSHSSPLLFTLSLTGVEGLLVPSASVGIEIDVVDPYTQDKQLNFVSAYTVEGDDVPTPDWSKSRNTLVYTLSNIPDNDYVAYVWARDKIRNVGRQEITFSIDTTPPTTAITFPSQDAVIFGRISISGVVVDRSGVIGGSRFSTPDLASYTLEYRPVGGGDSTWTLLTKVENAAEIAGDTIFDWNVGDLVGNYELKLAAADKLNHFNTTTVSFKIVTAQTIAYKDKPGAMTSEDNKLAMTLPAGAVASETPMSFSKLKLDEIELPASDSKNTIAGNVYRIEPAGLALQKPASLSCWVDPSSLVNAVATKFSGKYQGTGTRFPAIFQLVDGQWVLIGGTFDDSGTAPKVTAAIKTLGTFGVFITEETVGGPALSDLTCVPRMFSPRGGGFGNAMAISFALGEGGNVNLRIFNLTGHLIRELLAGESLSPGSHLTNWDGKDQNQNFVYDGMYIVRIEIKDQVEHKVVSVVNGQR